MRILALGPHAAEAHTQPTAQCPTPHPHVLMGSTADRSSSRFVGMGTKKLPLASRYQRVWSALQVEGGSQGTRKGGSREKRACAALLGGWRAMLRGGVQRGVVKERQQQMSSRAGEGLWQEGGRGGREGGSACTLAGGMHPYTMFNRVRMITLANTDDHACSHT